MEKIFDELFGELTYNLSWIGKTILSIFGVEHEVGLHIRCNEGENITANQRQVYINFEQHSTEILKNTEMAIFNYYLEVCQDYQARLQDAELIKKNAPVITRICELKDLVEAQTLLIDYDYQDEKPIRMGILFECTWEPEHGVAVRIENGEIVETGFQDIVI